MNRLPDDIEQYLLDSQHDRAIEALAKRRNIALDEARECVRIRLSEMTADNVEPFSQKSAGLRARLRAIRRGRDGRP
jgi:hypothetical protein